MEKEDNRLGGRLKRYVEVSWSLGSVLAKVFGARLGIGSNPSPEDVRETLGHLRGPLVKVFQLLAAIPDALPAAYAEALMHLQSNAPRMGAGFVKRRMRGELGDNWQTHFATFDLEATAAASLGQVHRATLPDGTPVACKLQYPDMASTVEADMAQVQADLNLYGHYHKGLDPTYIIEEVRDRLREELDYIQEAKHLKLYAQIFDHDPMVTVPDVYESHSTQRLLTMGWVTGDSLLTLQDAPQDYRNAIAKRLFHAWYYPLYHYGIIHGDPHLGNYFFHDSSAVTLLDYGCIRIFPSTFVAGSIDLYHALASDDTGRLRLAFEKLGFQNLTPDLLDVLKDWAHYLYGPLLDNRIRPIDVDHSSKRGQEIMGAVYEKLHRLGGVRPPREFVFMDRAAVGLGAAFMRLRAELNWHDLFHELIQGFDEQALSERQGRELALCKLI